MVEFAKKIAAKRQERAAKIQEAQGLLDKAEAESRDLTDDESATFDALHATAGKLDSDIARLESQRAAQASISDEDDLPAPVAEVRDQKQARRKVMRTFVLEGRGGLSDREVDLGVRDLGIDFSANRIRFDLRGQTVGTTTEGGYTVADDISLAGALERSMLAFGGMRQVSTVIRTATGADMPIPTTNDTGNTGAIVAEEAAFTAQDLVFGQLVLQSYLYESKLVKASVEFLQDTAVPFEGIIGGMLGERIARALNAHFTTGTGTAQPNGVVTAAGTGKTTASATAITYGEIVDLVHSVDPAYRANARFMMNDAVFAYVRKIVDGNSLPIFQDGGRSGAPATILGYPVEINQSMASAVTTGQKTMAFGDFSKYLIRDVGGIEVLVLRELYMANRQVGFVAYSRHDGDLLDAGTDPVKLLVQL